jgi:chromosome segregation ATPase
MFKKLWYDYQTGVTSVAIEGEDKSQVVVTGEEVDSACLTRSLRKKVGYATIVSVKKLEEEEKEEDNPTPISTCCQYRQFPLYYGAVSDPWPRNWCFM